MILYNTFVRFVSGTGTNCFKHWYELFQALVRTVSGTGTNSFKHWYCFEDSLFYSQLKFNLRRSLLICRDAFAQHDAALRPHVEEEVADAEVGEEACALGEHLVVGDGVEARVGF